jgi:hypothetical protein
LNFGGCEGVGGWGGKRTELAKKKKKRKKEV